MKVKTIKKFISLLQEIKESNTPVSHHPKSASVYMYINKLRTNRLENDFKSEAEEKLTTEALDLYDKILSPGVSKTRNDKHSVEKEDDLVEREFTSLNRDEDNKIDTYSFKILIRDKSPLQGTFTREEMNLIYRLYSSYGSSITQREISRFFPEFNLIDFKRILRAFNITKASAPFAPHIIEETSTEELLDMQMREKENDFLRKIEGTKARENEKLLNKYAEENYKLKQVQSNLVETIQESIKQLTIPETIIKKERSLQAGSLLGNTLVLHLADMHIGAKVESGSLYDNEYNYLEIKNRLDNIIYNVSNMPMIIDKIIVNILGDNLDGMDNQTARRDHYMPQQMDNLEQVKSFINLMTNFTAKLLEICPDVEYYSVKCGNHDGIVAYTTTLALKHLLHYTFGVNLTLFDTFFGTYKVGTHTYVICHGKDEKFMKRGLPLNLDDKSRAIICDWLEDNNIYGSDIHIIKGDLHSDNYNSSKKLDYRNVLSLFGGSDYSNYNYVRNNYGLSYDVITKHQNVIRGSFINI